MWVASLGAGIITPSNTGTNITPENDEMTFENLEVLKDHIKVIFDALKHTNTDISAKEELKKRVFQAESEITVIFALLKLYVILMYRKRFNKF